MVRRTVLVAGWLLPQKGVSQDALTGRVLDGKYVLGPIIGQGAIGRVYRARQVSLEREVAIKILNPGYTNHPEAIARFRLEARAASRISHPGIVTILDWGKDPDGLLYLVIEYLPGRDLFDIAQREAPLDSARIARLMQQVAVALAHAHSEGVIHRDLKPENLRVLEDPLAPAAHREIVKIYDFGVAHVTRGLTRVFTKVGVMVGTPYYMSPEQAASSDVFPQSDLYSCGVIMFLLATGTLPFVGAIATRRRHDARQEASATPVISQPAHRSPSRDGDSLLSRERSVAPARVGHRARRHARLDHRCVRSANPAGARGNDREAAAQASTALDDGGSHWCDRGSNRFWRRTMVEGRRGQQGGVRFGGYDVRARCTQARRRAEQRAWRHLQQAPPDRAREARRVARARKRLSGSSRRCPAKTSAVVDVAFRPTAGSGRAENL